MHKSTENNTKFFVIFCVFVSGVALMQKAEWCYGFSAPMLVAACSHEGDAQLRLNAACCLFVALCGNLTGRLHNMPQKQEERGA